MSVHGLFIGNNYRGESFELPDCEMDALSLAEEFEPYLTSGKVLLSKTRRSMISALGSLKDRVTRNYDLALVSFSGHGTTDTINGKQVQAIVCNDGTLIYEFELRQMLADLGLAALLADSCYAGGLTRGMQRGKTIPVRFCFTHEAKVPSKLPPQPHARYLACRAGETAASTGHGGAMTLAVLEAFRERKDETTFDALGKRIKQLLPNGEYEQHPVYSCTVASFGKKTLKSFRAKGWNRKPRT